MTTAAAATPAQDTSTPAVVSADAVLVTDRDRAPDELVGFGRDEDADLPPQAQQIARQPAEPRRAIALGDGGVAAFASMLERLAANPAVDVDKIERLIAMQKDVVATNAKAAFAAAKAAMLSEIPNVIKRGKIKVEGNENRAKRETPYAKFEDIVAVIRPVLHNHGFDLSHKTEWLDGGKIKIIGRLIHEAGHEERDEFITVADTGPGRNAVQSLGSAVSYGRRYTTKNLLLIAEHGEDDDGKKTGDADKSEKTQQSSAPQASTRKSQQQAAPKPPQAQSPAPAAQAPVAPAAAKGPDPHVGTIVEVDERTGGIVVAKLSTGFKCTTRDGEIINAIAAYRSNGAVVEVVCRASSDPLKYLPIVYEISQQRGAHAEA